MRSVNPPNSWVLMLLFAAATILAATVPSDAAAGSRFQSSPRAAGVSPLSPLPRTASPTASLGHGPATQVSPHAQQVSPLQTQPVPAPSHQPTAIPLTAAQRTATAVAASFLPAPTLTSPGATGPIAPVPGPQSLNAPPVAHSVPATPVPTRSGLGQLIDNGLLIASILWLFCGAVAVAGIAVGVFWYFRKHS